MTCEEALKLMKKGEFDRIDDSLWESKEFFVEVAKTKHYGMFCWINFPDSFFENESLLLQAVEYDPLVLMRAHDVYDDEEFAFKAVGRNGKALGMFSARIRSDKKIVEEAIIDYGGAISHASSELQKDKEFILKMTEIDPWVPFMLDEDYYIDDVDVAKVVVKQKGDFLEKFSNFVRNDKDVVFKAVMNCPNAIKFAGKSIRKDPTILVGLQIGHVRENLEALNYFTSELLGSKEILSLLLTAVRENLIETSFEILDDEEFEDEDEDIDSTLRKTLDKKLTYVENYFQSKVGSQSTLTDHPFLVATDDIFEVFGIGEESKEEEGFVEMIDSRLNNIYRKFRDNGLSL